MIGNPKAFITSPQRLKALVEELEAVGVARTHAPETGAAIPALVILTELIAHGGKLAISRDPEDIGDALAVLLHMQGVAVNDATLETAIATWLKKARSRLNKDVGA